MDGRHDYSSLDRHTRSLFHHAHAGHHPPGPTPPPPPMLSPVGFPEAAGGGLSSGLARQSLVELARVNAATPGGGGALGPPPPVPPLPGGSGYGPTTGRSYHGHHHSMAPSAALSAALHSPRSGYQSPMLNPFLSAATGGGGAGGVAGGGGSSAGSSSSSSSTGGGSGGTSAAAAAVQAAEAAAYKSMLSAATTPALPSNYWPPPPPSPHSTPSTAEGLGRHSLTGSLYPGYLPLLPGPDSMGALYSSSSSPLGGSMHPYHRIYDLHKEAFMGGSGGLGGSTSSVTGVTENPLFAYPGAGHHHTSCSAACYTSGCSRMAPMSATLELQEQARALHYHLQQQQHLHAKLQEEQDREEWERRREREERVEREREDRGRHEERLEREERERAERAAAGREREREKEKARERDDRERERDKEAAAHRDRDSPTTTGNVRPRSSSVGSRKSRSSPPGGRTVKTEHDDDNRNYHHHYHHQPHTPLHPPVQHHHPQPRTHNDGQNAVNPRSSPHALQHRAVSPNKSKIATTTCPPCASSPGLRVAEVSGLPRPSTEIRSTRGEDHTRTTPDVSPKHKPLKKSSEPATKRVTVDSGESSKTGSTSTSAAAAESVVIKADPGEKLSSTEVSADKVTTPDRHPQHQQGSGSPPASAEAVQPKPNIDTLGETPDFSGSKCSIESNDVTDVKVSNAQQQQPSAEDEHKGRQHGNTHRTIVEQERTTKSPQDGVISESVPTTQADEHSELNKTSSSTPDASSSMSSKSQSKTSFGPTSVTTTVPQSLICLKKQLTENIPSDILTGNRSSQMTLNTSSHPPQPPAAARTSRHDPPRPVLTSALQSSRRLLYSPDGALTTTTTTSTTTSSTTSSSAVTTSSASTMQQAQQTRKTAVTSTTSTLTLPKMTSAGGAEGGGVYTVCSSTKSVSMVCVPAGVTVSSGESSSMRGSTGGGGGSRERSLGTLYSYSHVSVCSIPESGPRKVHATTFTPEVGTVHQTTITSPTSATSSSSPSSSPTESKRSTKSHHTSSSVTSSSTSSSTSSGRPCLSGGEHGKSSSSSSLHQASTGAKHSRLGHGKSKKEPEAGGGAKASCRLQTQHYQTAAPPAAPSVLSKGPLSSSKPADALPRTRLQGHGADTDHRQGKSTDDLRSHNNDNTSRHSASSGHGRALASAHSAARDDFTSMPSGKWSDKGSAPANSNTIGMIIPKEEATDDDQVASSGDDRRHHDDHHRLAGHAAPEHHHRASGLNTGQESSTMVKEEGRHRRAGLAAETLEEQRRRPHQLPPPPGAGQGLLNCPPGVTHSEHLLAPGGHIVHHDGAPQSDLKPVLSTSDVHARHVSVPPPSVSTTSSNKHGAAPDVSGQTEETPATSGSNIPVGIAIARKRGDKRHGKSDESGQTGPDSGTERTRRREAAETDAPRATNRDNKHITAKPGTDIGPNLIVTGGGSRAWHEGEEAGSTGVPPSSTTQSTGAPPVGAWGLPPTGGHPQLPPPPPMWLGQTTSGGFPIPASVDPAQLSIPPPGGLKLAQDPITGQVYVIPDVPLDSGRVWPPAAGFPTPGSLQGQQLQFLQQQYVQQLQQLQASGQGAPPSTAGTRPVEGVKTEGPCRQEEQAVAPHYQHLQQQAKQHESGNTGETARPARPHFPLLKTSPDSQTSSDSTETQSQQQSQGSAGQPPAAAHPGEGGQNTAAHPFLVGLGQTFPGLSAYAPHMPYYLDPALLQQLSHQQRGPTTGAAAATAPTPAPPSTTSSTSTGGVVTRAVSVVSRGCSPVVFPPDNADLDIDATSRAEATTTMSIGCGPSQERASGSCTVGCQTSASPVLELLRMYSKEEGTQTTGAAPPVPVKSSSVEVGVQLDSDSDSCCAMPQLTARTIDCGVQADEWDRVVGGSGSQIRTSSSHYYDSDRRSASPQPPALVAEGSPCHQPDDAPPTLTEQPPLYHNDDTEGLAFGEHSAFSLRSTNRSMSSGSATPSTAPPRGSKSIFDLDLEFLSRQILEASNGLELLSTLAERARSEQQQDETTSSKPLPVDDVDEEDEVTEREDEDVPAMAAGRAVVNTTDTEDTDADTDINRNYNAPKASMFMDGPSMYSFSTKFSPSAKKDTTNRLSSAFSYTEEQQDASQIEMRMKLADLQRKYREKQRMLAKLQPKRDREEERHLIKRGPGRPRKRRFKKSSSKSESPSKSPRSESASAERTPQASTSEPSPKKKKKDSSSKTSCLFSFSQSKCKSKTSDSGKASSGSSSGLSKRPETTGGSVSSSSRSEKKKKSSSSSVHTGLSSGSKSSKSGSSKSKSSSSSKSQSKKKDGKSSQIKKSKVKKEERDLDLEDSELEDVSWLFDEDEINPPPTVFAPSPLRKLKSSDSGRSQNLSASSSHDHHTPVGDHGGSPGPPSLAAAAGASSRSPYSFTESYDETSDEGSLGLLARFASSNDWRCSVAAATSAALKSKKRKKRSGGFGDLNEAPVKKRKPGRPKKFEHDELETGMTETIVDKKSRKNNLSLLHINTNTSTTSSSGTISSCSSTSSSSSSSSSSCSVSGVNVQGENTTTTSSSSPRKKAKTPSTSSSTAKEHKKTESNTPFLEEEWSLRRSERIFLSDPNLNSPPLPADNNDKSHSAPTPRRSEADTAASPIVVAPAASKPSKLAKTPNPSTPASTNNTTTPSSSGGTLGTTALSKSSKSNSSKLKNKLKTVNDISQKVKKKYKKPLKPGVTKTSQTTIKSESMDSSSESSKVLMSTSSSTKSGSVSGASSKSGTAILGSSKLNTSSVKVLSSTNSSKVTSVGVSGSSNSKIPGSGNNNSSRIKYDQVYTDSDSDSDTGSDGDNVPLIEYIDRATTPEPRSCVICKDDLRSGLRVLIYMEGLFYEGQVKAIEPPDVYGVVIDGERGSRPHILSQEELLNEAVLDVQPASTRCLIEGTRVCAYWSQQFSCLYPGTVARSSPNPSLDKKLVNVEFDDGDSGRIPIEHIRMLPHDYPLVTVGPSPILVLSKRRRPRTASEDTTTEIPPRSDHRNKPDSTGISTGVGGTTSSFQSPPPDEALCKQRRRLAKTVGAVRKLDNESAGLMPSISETSGSSDKQQQDVSTKCHQPIDEYDPQREFGPDIPPPTTSATTTLEPPGGGKKEPSESPVLQPVLSMPTITSSPVAGATKKKHKHKEKKKERDKERALKRSGGGDTHKHKHHHHHHHHKKHKHKSKSSSACGSTADSSSAAAGGGSSAKSASAPPVIGAGNVKGSLLSQATPSSNTKGGAPPIGQTNTGSAPAGVTSAKEQLAVSTSSSSASSGLMVTATSPSVSGDKKLTMRIRTNSTDTHPLSPNKPEAATNTNASPTTTPMKTHEKRERAQSERASRAARQATENYSEDDSPDTTSDEEDGDDDDYDDSDFTTDGKSSSSSSKKKQKSSMSSSSTTTSAGSNKGRQTKRQTSVENKSKMAAFLPARQLWRWMGTSTRRPGMKGKAKKEFYKAITRGKEIIRVGDCAVFLSTGRPHLPYVGRIESLWEAWGGNMVVKVKWFYHPEETKGGKKLLEIKGALYQSPHVDENDVQTISHKCEVMRYTDYKSRSTTLTHGSRRLLPDYENDDVYYLAGTYEPTVGMITLEDDVKLLSDVKSS